MKTLQDEVQARGFTVAHIKTDSIKIPDATPEIIQFCMDFAKKYGYEFEHEATYDRMCLVNDAVYIAKYAGPDGKWTATGTQFQVPYVFKTLFSKEPIEFKDLCETKSVSTALYLDMNEGMTVQSAAEKELADREYNESRSDGKLRKLNPAFKDIPDDELMQTIASGHNYVFIGRIGQFCPIKDGCGGGVLVREKDGKYYAATGTKKPDGTPYRWLESETVRTLSKEDDIDRSYYNELVDAAVETISKYGDFEGFIA